MANPKRAELISRARSLGVPSDDVARRLINDNNVASFKKLEQVVTKYKAKTVKSGGRIRQESIDPSTVKSIVAKTSSIKTHKRRGKSITLPGPRGFRLGPTWMKSIAECRGAALKTANLPKLLATAKVKGINVPAGEISQRELVQKLAQRLHQ